MEEGCNESNDTTNMFMKVSLLCPVRFLGFWVFFLPTTTRGAEVSGAMWWLVRCGTVAVRLSRLSQQKDSVWQPKPLCVIALGRILVLCGLLLACYTLLQCLAQGQARRIWTYHSSKFEIWLYHEGPTLQRRITQKSLELSLSFFHLMNFFLFFDYLHLVWWL